jgi:hypothetical protein
MKENFNNNKRGRIRDPEKIYPGSGIQDSDPQHCAEHYRGGRFLDFLDFQPAATGG